jgi:hypothetical protein
MRFYGDKRQQEREFKSAGDWSLRRIAILRTGLLNSIIFIFETNPI